MKRALHSNGDGGIDVSGEYAVSPEEEMPGNIIQTKLVCYILTELLGRLNGSRRMSLDEATKNLYMQIIVNSIGARFRAWHESKTIHCPISTKNPRIILQAVLEHCGLSVDVYFGKLESAAKIIQMQAEAGDTIRKATA